MFVFGGFTNAWESADSADDRNWVVMCEKWVWWLRAYLNDTLPMDLSVVFYNSNKRTGHRSMVLVRQGCQFPVLEAHIKVEFIFVPHLTDLVQTINNIPLSSWAEICVCVFRLYWTASSPAFSVPFSVVVHQQLFIKLMSNKGKRIIHNTHWAVKAHGVVVTCTSFNF